MTNAEDCRECGGVHDCEQGEHGGADMLDYCGSVVVCICCGDDITDIYRYEVTRSGTRLIRK